MSVLSDVLRELEAGADAASVARHLNISDDLAAAAIDHWVQTGRAVRPASVTALPAQDSTRSEPCPGCAPRPRWRMSLSCHGCPFATPPPR